jgi:DsbC/DsbD-like thiol-disulfide interchange protein
VQRLIFAVVLGLAASSANHAGEREKFVQGSVKASKIDADGKQTVTVTLEIKKGFFIFANPVDYHRRGKAYDDLDDERVNVVVQANKRLKTEVHYPMPKTRSEGIDSYKYYEGVIAVDVSVQRMAGDQSPLEITIDCRPMARTVCVLPERIKLTAK